MTHRDESNDENAFEDFPGCMVKLFKIILVLGAGLLAYYIFN